MNETTINDNCLLLLNELLGSLQNELQDLQVAKRQITLYSKVWLSVDELYQYLDISESTLTKWVNNGLPFYQFGNGKRYFKRVEIDNFMQGLRKVEQTIDYNAEAANEQIRRIMRG
jgi:excisionase family DNA binding protein